MTEFNYGSLIFNFESNNNEFLVIADSWHPFWKVRTNNKNIEIFKANFIFKGIKLPKGKYSFELYYDTSTYKIGIYISLISFLFLIFYLSIFIYKKK